MPKLLDLYRNLRVTPEKDDNGKKIVERGHKKNPISKSVLDALRSQTDWRRI